MQSDGVGQGSTRRAAVQQARAPAGAVRRDAIPLLLVDAGGGILRSNAEADRLFGYEARELIGQPVECLVPERQRGRTADLRAALFGRVSEGAVAAHVAAGAATCVNKAQAASHFYAAILRPSRPRA